MFIRNCCLFLLFFFKNAEGCSFAELLADNVLGCVHKDVDVSIDELKDATVETECYIKKGQRTVIIQCTESGWKVNNDGIKEVSREKRNVQQFGDLWKNGRAGPKPDKTAPIITCKPSIINKTAGPRDIYAKAFWKPPTAMDDEDGKISPKRKHWRKSGSYFPENDTVVIYEAKDKSGNRAECSITVNVKVVRCEAPRKVENGYYQCIPVTEHLYGGVCKFGCYEGYDLEGPEILGCQKNGTWNGSQPFCKPFKCPDLQSIEGAGSPICTNDYHFRSVCSYNCMPGYDMPPKVSKAIVCNKDRQWIKHGLPKCIDVEPPRFVKCPGSKIFGTDVGKNSTKVDWNPPEVEDNSHMATMRKKKGRRPGKRLTPNTYLQHYVAHDDAGNKASDDCSFYIVVKDIRCPKLYPKPYVQVRCRDGYRSGAQCTIKCEHGKILKGQKHVDCKKSNVGLYGYWDWLNDKQTECENGGTCVKIKKPKNGRIVCDNWEGGNFCQVQCNNGTEMSSVHLNTLIVCNTDGSWSRKPRKIQKCQSVNRQNSKKEAKTKSTSRTQRNLSDVKKEKIKNNIEEKISKSESCPDGVDCESAVVQVKAMKPPRFRRRSVHENITDDYFIIEIIITFPLVNLSTTDDHIDVDFEELADSVGATLSKEKDSIFGNTSVELLETQSEGLEIVCPEGSVQSDESWNCIDCPEGSYYAKETDPVECVACRKGTYQGEAAQLECNRCPVGTTTHDIGAKSLNDCIEACHPGSYSQDGLLPCSPCEQGHYQPSYGQTFCRPCKGTKSTLTFGASSASQCDEFDIEYLPDEESITHVDLEESVTVRDFTMSFWYQVKSANISESSPTIKLVNAQGHVEWSWVNMKTITRGNTDGVDIDLMVPDSRWHHITIYSNSSCDLAITVDGIPLPTYTQSLSCQQFNFDRISIFVGNGAGGSISKLNIWHGERNTHYGQRCFSNVIGDILSWKKFEEANMTGAYFHLPSQCDDFDNCVSSPCLHGSCTDALHGFTCTCDLGFIGTQCDVNIDDCDVNVCMNNATCMDGIALYSCLCPKDFTGQYCEIEMVNGGWSEWGNWSECTTSCGEGLMTRKRLCNNPTPDNGGMNCVGESYDKRGCNNSVCPVCPSISAPVNGSKDCTNDTESINCTISCDKGFDFDTQPLDLYFCGPATFYEWNYQTDENPERRLPECVEIKLPETLKVSYSASYINLTCLTLEVEEIAKAQINVVLSSMLSNVTCLNTQSCNLTYADVTDCDVTSREKRATRTAGFRLQLASNPTEENTFEVMSDLEEAFAYIINATENGELTVEIQNVTFEVDLNQTDLSGEVVCKSGEMRINEYCVPCGKGSYLNVDYCEACPIGMYQEMERQVECVKCPEMTSTLGIRSTSIDDCNVNQLVHEESVLEVPWLEITIGTVSALFIVTVVLLVRKRFKSTHGGEALSSIQSKSADLPTNESVCPDDGVNSYRHDHLIKPVSAIDYATGPFNNGDDLSMPMKTFNIAQFSETNVNGKEKTVVIMECSDVSESKPNDDIKTEGTLDYTKGSDDNVKTEGALDSTIGGDDKEHVDVKTEGTLDYTKDGDDKEHVDVVTEVALDSTIGGDDKEHADVTPVLPKYFTKVTEGNANETVRGTRDAEADDIHNERERENVANN